MLFLLVNAVLFIRPSELITEIQGWPIYEVLILVCLATSVAAISQRFGAPGKILQPILVCFFGVYLTVWLSNLARLHFGDAWAGGVEFTKVAIYFVLLVSLVNTYGRLRVFMLWLVLCIAVLALLAVLHFHGMLQLPNLEAVEQREYSEELDEVVVILRMCSTGLYHDPNDLCLILVVGMALSLYWLQERGVGPLRWAALAPLGLFGYALGQTQSRGGFLALLAGLITLLVDRFGWKKTAPLAALVLPVLALAFAGRQLNLDLTNKEDTAQTRIQLWREGLELFKSSPIFGIGKGNFQEETGHVAHNSFLHCFTELGVLGGTCFAAVMALPVWLLRRRPRLPAPLLPPDLRARPYLLAAMVAFITGIFSLSRAYVTPTYTVVGLVVAYGELPAVRGLLPPLPLTRRLALMLALLGICVLGGLWVLVHIVPSK